MTNIRSANIYVNFRGADGSEYSLNGVPPKHITGLVHKRLVDDQANSLTLNVVDTSAYDIENYLMGMGDPRDRNIYYQYGYDDNLTKIFQGLVYDYTPTIAASTISLSLLAFSQETNSVNSTESASYGSSSTGSDLSLQYRGTRNVAKCVSVLNTKMSLKSDSVLRGWGTEFTNISNKYGVDPLLAAAISIHETGWWTSPAAKRNNFGGMKYKGKTMDFNTPTEGLDRYLKNLKKNYYDYGLTVPSTIGPKYCPNSQSWINQVTKLYKQLTNEYDSSNARSMMTRSRVSESTIDRRYKSFKNINLTSPQVILDGNDTIVRVSDIIKVIANRNNWKLGTIETTQILHQRITQCNISDLEFIKTVLKPLAVSEYSSESGYVFYLTSEGNTMTCNFHIPRAAKSASQLYRVTIDSSGGILNSSHRYNEKSSRKSVINLDEIHSTRSAGSSRSGAGEPTDTAIATGASSVILKKSNASSVSNSSSKSNIKVEERTMYGRHSSEVLSWSPGYKGVLIMSGDTQPVSHSVDSTTGDQLRTDTIGSLKSQYDSRSYLGSTSKEIPSSSAINVLELSSKLNNRWYSASRHIYQTDADVLGRPDIDLLDTIEFEIYLQNKLHHSSGKYLVTQVTDSISTSGFTTKLQLQKNIDDYSQLLLASESVGAPPSGVDNSKDQIGHASIDENGKTIGSKSGDQTSKEVVIRTWYSKPWNVYLKCTDSVIAASAASYMTRICNNDSYGYSMNNRWKGYRSILDNGGNVELGKGDFDCSSLVMACYALAGLGLGDLPSKNPTTSNMRKMLESTGKFIAYTDKDHISTANYAGVGDIYLKEGSHVAMSLTNHATVGKSSSSVNGKSTTINKASLSYGQEDAIRSIGGGGGGVR